MVGHPQVFSGGGGDEGEAVDSCFSALIHVESELNSCIGPLHFSFRSFF